MNSRRLLEIHSRKAPNEEKRLLRGSNGNLAAEGFVFAARMIHLAEQQLQELIVKAGQKFPCSSAGAFRLI